MEQLPVAQSVLQYRARSLRRSDW